MNRQGSSEPFDENLEESMQLYNNQGTTSSISPQRNRFEDVPLEEDPLNTHFYDSDEGNNNVDETDYGDEIDGEDGIDYEYDSEKDDERRQDGRISPQDQTTLDKVHEELFNAPKENDPSDHNNFEKKVLLGLSKIYVELLDQKKCREKEKEDCLTFEDLDIDVSIFPLTTLRELNKLEDDLLDQHYRSQMVSKLFI